MTLRVLSVGNCGADEFALRRYFAQRFAAEFAAVDDAPAALTQLRVQRADLVVVNRLLDLTGDSGLDVIAAIKADPQLADVPVMLISNYPEWQAQAEATGALPGFGKAQLGSDETARRIGQALGQATEREDRA